MRDFFSQPLLGNINQSFDEGFKRKTDFISPSPNMPIKIQKAQWLHWVFGRLRLLSYLMYSLYHGVLPLHYQIGSVHTHYSVGCSSAD